jgi:hypothetical protein
MTSSSHTRILLVPPELVLRLTAAVSSVAARLRAAARRRLAKARGAGELGEVGELGVVPRQSNTGVDGKQEEPKPLKKE